MRGGLVPAVLTMLFVVACGGSSERRSVSESPATTPRTSAVVESPSTTRTVDPIAEPTMSMSVPTLSIGPSPTSSRDDVGRSVEPVRLVFFGDVMLGRGVAPVVDGDPTSVFERLRPVVVGADLAFGNLESPLTGRPHVIGEYALEADPDAAVLLAGAGFDVMGVANNHAFDAGPETVIDTFDALEAAGIAGVGAGASIAEARQPLVVTVGGVTIGVVAFDMSGGQAATVTTAGVNSWDADVARRVVTELHRTVDVVVVGLHGGVEYLTRPDPVLVRVTDLLADWGADVVWGHGAHVVYPVETLRGSTRMSVIAPGLGNTLFDQSLPRTMVGLALEVLADDDGVVAMRTGQIRTEAGRSEFEGWDEPAGDTVALDGDWWTPVRAWTPIVAEPTSLRVDGLLPADYEEVARSVGDVTGTGDIDVVVAYRRPARTERAHDTFDEVDWFDELGRTAHLAVYTSEARMRWGSALLFEPVGAIAVCDGSMALGFTTLDDPTIVAGGAWLWDGFGFRTAAMLPGTATPACADIDHDGRTDPVLADRRVPVAAAIYTPSPNETND